MRRRFKMTRKKSRRNFKSGARVKSKNFRTSGLMRGGIRL